MCFVLRHFILIMTRLIGKLEPLPYSDAMLTTQPNLSSEFKVALEQVLDLAKKHNVARLELFGSAAKDALGDESDIDFLVEFEPLPVLKHGAAYLDLKKALENLLNRRGIYSS